MSILSTQKARAAGARAPGAAGAGGPARRRPLQPPGLAWILPALVVSVGIIYYCIGYTGFISTLNWDGVSPDPVHVGMANYSQALSDGLFWATIRHTALFFVVTFGVQSILGIVLAALLHSNVRLGVLYKVVIFIPVVLAPAIMAPVFRQIFSGAGQFNWLLQHIGLGSLAQPWLAQSSTALGIVMFVHIWEWTGMSFILYFSAMGQVDPEVVEAARIDGAGNVRMLVSIILPSILGTVVALAILNLIGALKLFDIPFLLTLGGPNFATEFLGTFIYREIVPLGVLGYGGSLSIILLVLAVGTTLVIRVRGREKGGV